MVDGGSRERSRPELLVDARRAPGDSSDGSGSAMAPVLGTALGAAALAKYVSPGASLVGLAAALLAFAVLRKPDAGRYLLRVDDGTLEVTRERPRASPGTRIVLDDLLDVALDAETRASGARGGVAATRVRLALVRRGADAPLFLPDERITPLEGQEWLGKVRVFLRDHGWLPEAERPAPDSARV